MLKKLLNANIKNIFNYGVLFILLICIRSSVLGNYMVPTGSMNPTIIEGDYFFANKLAYRLKIPLTDSTLMSWNIPKRGDIIAFKYPKDESIYFTKRVIGLPGDIIQLKEKQLFVNNSKIETKFMKNDERYNYYEENLNGTRYIIKHSYYSTDLDNTNKIVVPSGYLFVMGDNRDNSSDSRVWGFVPIKNIEGKLILRWLNIDRISYIPDFTRIGFIK